MKTPIGQEWKCTVCGTIVVNAEPSLAIHLQADDEATECGGALVLIGEWYMPDAPEEEEHEHGPWCDRTCDPRWPV